MPDQILELRVNGFAGRDFCQTVFHYKTDAPDADDFQEAGKLIGALDDGVNPNVWLTRFLNCCSDAYNLTTLSARRVNGTGGNTWVTRLPGSGLPGNESGPAHANQAAGVLIWIADPEPENTGRNFMPGVPESFCEGGRWTAAAYTAYEAFITFHLAGLTVGGDFFQPVLWDRLAATSRDLEHGYLSPKLGTLRRREKPV